MPMHAQRDKELLDALNRHPSLRQRIERIVAVVDDAGGDLSRADAAERRMIEEIQRLGQERLQAWAQRQVEQTTRATLESGEARRAGKKLCRHSTFGLIEVEEVLCRQGTRLRRSFSLSAQVSHRCCSQPLQRVVTDLVADVSFQRAAEKLWEHYRVRLPVETIRRIVEGHGQAILEVHEVQAAWPTEPGTEWLVAEMDGGDGADHDPGPGAAGPVPWEVAGVEGDQTVSRASPWPCHVLLWRNASRRCRWAGARTLRLCPSRRCVSTASMATGRTIGKT
ncbi:hypothetical protein Atep_17030 [Allochromatium tepidum]|uniref:DUF222 domain-containing protein n=1 Tax=Allochromatium tepidum TaxID=553982 RepID=A0ABM7QMR0_9GAMM|nr:hypothetical protein Atep_17030 [Allochromatium tepidum]